jgi:hypothetical protein
LRRSSCSASCRWRLSAFGRRCSGTLRPCGRELRYQTGNSSKSAPPILQTRTMSKLALNANVHFRLETSHTDTWSVSVERSRCAAGVQLRSLELGAIADRVRRSTKCTVPRVVVRTSF